MLLSSCCCLVVTVFLLPFFPFEVTGPTFAWKWCVRATHAGINSYFCLDITGHPLKLDLSPTDSTMFRPRDQMCWEIVCRDKHAGINSSFGLDITSHPLNLNLSPTDSTMFCPN